MAVRASALAGLLVVAKAIMPRCLARIAVARDNVDEKAAEVVNVISAEMTPETLIALNTRSVKEEIPAATIAKDWLAEQDL